MADAEIQAMSVLADALSDLEEQARGRVLRWAAERYGVTVGSTGRGSSGRKGDADDVAGADEVDREDGSDEDGRDGPRQRAFQHFAELYDAVGPSTDPERVLVASYWTQVVSGKASFGSQQLNKDLKDLGHAVGAINKAMAANMGKKPALILQVARGGNARQARKTYKLSDAGRKWVESKFA